MGLLNCNCKCNCTLLAIIGSVIIGIIAAFLQITSAIEITSALLWVLLGIGVVYLAVLSVAEAIASRGSNGCDCKCGVISALLTGILGTILFSLVLLAVGIETASALSAFLVGLLLFFFSLTVSSTACYVKCLAGCNA